MVVVARRAVARLRMYVLYHLTPVVESACGSCMGSHTPPSSANTGTRQSTNFPKVVYMSTIHQQFFTLNHPGSKASFIILWYRWYHELELVSGHR